MINHVADLLFLLTIIKSVSLIVLGAVGAFAVLFAAYLIRDWLQDQSRGGPPEGV